MAPFTGSRWQKGEQVVLESIHNVEGPAGQTDRESHGAQADGMSDQACQ